MFWFEPPDLSLTWDYIIPNVFSDSEINKLHEYVNLNNHSLIKAKINSETEEPHYDYRRSDIIFLHQYNQFEDIYKIVLDNAVQANLVHFKFNLNYIEPLQYSIYKEDDLGYYDVHIDSVLRDPKGFNRKLTFSILLNDTSEFEGGDLCLHYTKDPYKINLQKGSMVLFPSYMPHSVTPVTKGIRKTLVGWLCGPNLV